MSAAGSRTGGDSKSRIGLLTAAVLLVVALAAAIAAVARQEAPSVASFADVSLSELPPQARATIELIRKGGPFPYRRDGATFGNREQRLPLKPRGYYTEHTVTTPSERDRGPRRIVAGKGLTGDPTTSGEYYYTDDHYNSFRRIRE